MGSAVLTPNEISGLRDRCRLIQGSFAGLKVPQRDARRAAFRQPAPAGWLPAPGMRVYIRPGITVGAWNVATATVYDVCGKTATVRVQAAGAKFKVAEIPLADLRPVQ